MRGALVLKELAPGVGQCLAGGGAGEVLMVRANHPHSQTGASPSASQECAALGHRPFREGGKGSEVLEIVHEGVVRGWTCGG